MWGQIASIGASLLGPMLSGGDGGAGAAQAALNKELLNIFRQDRAFNQPFKQALFNQLKNRASKQQPSFKLPTAPPTFNPFGGSRMTTPQSTPGMIAGGATQPQQNVGSFLRKAATRPQQGQGGQ